MNAVEPLTVFLLQEISVQASSGRQQKIPRSEPQWLDACLAGWLPASTTLRALFTAQADPASCQTAATALGERGSLIRSGLEYQMVDLRV